MSALVPGDPYLYDASWNLEHAEALCDPTLYIFTAEERNAFKTKVTPVDGHFGKFLVDNPTYLVD
jgi:hypothetical protein